MTRPPFSFVGNLGCLDFLNTEPILDGARVDLLEGFADLVAWLAEAGTLSGADRRRALARWEGTAEGAAALAGAKALRAAMRGGVSRLVAGKTAGGAMVQAVNRILAARPTRSRLVWEGARYATRVEPVEESALGLLAPVVESAAWLLEHGDAALVRRCGSADCVLLFYDTTKNRSRRWCSMEGCGSRAKALTYYRRHRPA